MRVLVATMGSRGDIQPFVALAKGLQAAGHDVLLAAPSNFEGFVQQYHVRFASMGIDIHELLQREDVRKIIESGKLTAVLTGRVTKMLRELYEEGNRKVWELAQNTDAIIYKTPVYAASSIAAVLNIPAVEVSLFPWHITSEFPPPFLGTTFSLGRTYNRLLAKAARLVLWQSGRMAVNPFRQKVLGLKPFSVWGPPAAHRAPRLPFFLPVSPLVVPKPRDFPQNVHLTGYWFLDSAQDWTPPQELTDFLDASDKPVYIGFGSMTNSDPRQVGEVVLKALERAGQRGVLLGGWGGLGEDVRLPNTVLQVNNVPHDWLFPRMAAVVHHGGAGTTAAGLRSGVPSIVVPHNFDQPFWGKRVYDLGVGPEPVPFKRLSANSLARAIDRAVSDQTMRERSRDMGERIRAENGVQTAINLFHQYCEYFPRQERELS